MRARAAVVGLQHAARRVGAPRALCTAASDSSSGGGTLFERASRVLTQSSATQKGSETMTRMWSSGKGWREALDKGVHEKQKAEREEKTQERFASLAQVESYAVDNYEAELRSVLDAFEKNMTPIQRGRLLYNKVVQGGNLQESLEEQKQGAERKLRIFGELTVHERRQPRLLTLAAQRAIADKLAVDVRHVTEALFEFMWSYAQWTYVRREYLRNRRLPRTDTEFQWMVAQRPTKDYITLVKLFQQRKERLEKELQEEEGKRASRGARRRQRRS